MIKYHYYTTHRKLNSLKFSIWNTTRQQGHAMFVGNIREVSLYLEKHDVENLEVSALDLQQMHSLSPVKAEEWLDWYYIKALSALEENNFDEDVFVPYITKLNDFDAQELFLAYECN